METLQYDPRTKQWIKDRLYEFLYSPVEKQFKERLNSIILRNSILGGFSHQSFMYKNEFYSCDSKRPPLKKNRLLPALKDAMEEYLSDLKQLNESEIPYVVGFITQVLNASNNIADYKEIFPESVHPPLERIFRTYPCKSEALDDIAVKELVIKNQSAIHLMKRRQALNLIT